MPKPNVKLKSRIFELGLTQEELARKVGISSATLSAIVQGKSDLKQLRAAQMIARELGMSTDELWPLPPKDDKK